MFVARCRLSSFPARLSVRLSVPLCRNLSFEMVSSTEQSIAQSLFLLPSNAAAQNRVFIQLTSHLNHFHKIPEWKEMLLRHGSGTNKAYTPVTGCFICIVLSFTQSKATANTLMKEYLDHGHTPRPLAFLENGH